MTFPSKETSDKLRKKYPIGCRVKLLSMSDPRAPHIGTMGTVIGVDDMASIMVHWDNGSVLSVLYEIDECRRVDNV